MNTFVRTTMLSLCITFAIGSMSSETVHAAAGPVAESITASKLVYTPEEMFGFNIDRYLAKRAPHLRSQSEVISHWAGYSSISPKVLIALMEQQSGVVTRARIRGNAMARPFGKLSRQNGFNNQVRDVAQQLQMIVDSQRNAAVAAKAQGKAFISENPLQVLYSKAGESASSAAVLGDAQFSSTYAALFNERLSAKVAPDLVSEKITANASFSTGIVNMRLPFPKGESWWVGPAHASNGANNATMSSLDMNKGSNSWGDSQANNKVTASANGTFKRHSSCSAEIIHAEGWSTTYYHMANLQIADGASVLKGTYIGNPAKSKTQALCDGGSSDGPHVHWSLKQNGAYHTLDGLPISGYLVSAKSTISYDDDCSKNFLYFWPATYCPYDNVYNP
jgi:DNA-directed RNA polymerase subunit K/omega